jgi:hypothetical protein
MAGSSKKMHVNDEVVFYELLQENEYNDISESMCSTDTEIYVKIVSYDEQSVSSDEENMNDTSSMQHGICAMSGAKRPHFPFTGKPGINVDLEDPIYPPGIFRFVLYTIICGSNNQINKSTGQNFFIKHTYSSKTNI